MNPIAGFGSTHSSGPFAPLTIFQLASRRFAPFVSDRLAWASEHVEKLDHTDANPFNQRAARRCNHNYRQQRPLADRQHELLTSHVHEVGVPITETRGRR